MAVTNWNVNEIVNDFEVTVERKKLWKIQLNLATELIRVCDQNGIKIFAVCGTLLGAVRHQGFIPWDDDMDFGMDRENFEKLLKVAKDFKPPYFLQHVYTDRYCYSDVMRLRNTNTTAIERKDRKSKCNNGVYIDIFPFDRIPDSRTEMNTLIRKTALAKKFVYWPRNTAVTNKMDKVKVYLAKIVSGIIGYNNLYAYYQTICKKYNSNNLLERVGIVSGSADHSEFYYYYEDIQKVVFLPFEGIKIPVPVGFKRCLEVNYGDYMKLPLIEKRGMWHENMLDIDINTPYVEFQKEHGWIK